LGDILQSTQITGREYPFTYTYNLANTMLGMTLPSGRTLTWTYDSANRIASAVGTPPGGTAKTYASSITYASQGPIKQFNLGNGLVEARTYDTYRQQLTGVSLGPNGSILNLGFDYCTNTPPQTSCTNNNGNLQSQTISPLGVTFVTQNYTYDSYNRLSTSGEKAGTTTTWSENFNYDSFGNRWVLPNPVGITLSPWTVTTNFYNSATNRLTYNDFGYDNAGNQTTISPYTVSYDVENRQSGFTSTSNGSATYTYDGDGRRVEKAAGGVTTTYVYDATGNLAAEYSSQPPPMPCQTCYLTTDHLGSTRVITSQSGGLVSRHDFLPFGEELATSNRTAAQGYGVADNVMQRYTGQQRDLEGPVLDFFGARYFQGAQGRFTTPDWSVRPRPTPYALRTDPQTLNLYSYLRNNPLAKVDADGHGDLGITLAKCHGSFDRTVGEVSRTLRGADRDVLQKLLRTGLGDPRRCPHCKLYRRDNRSRDDGTGPQSPGAVYSNTSGGFGRHATDHHGSFPSSATSRRGWGCRELDDLFSLRLFGRRTLFRGWFTCGVVRNNRGWPHRRGGTKHALTAARYRARRCVSCNARARSAGDRAY
jgi:RHS repeat-associated protein